MPAAAAVRRTTRHATEVQPKAAKLGPRFATNQVQAQSGGAGELVRREGVRRILRSASYPLNDKRTVAQKEAVLAAAQVIEKAPTLPHYAFLDS